MVFNNIYWSTQTKLDLLARWIIVHSILYYTHDISIVSDHMFDANSKQLADMLWEASNADVDSTQYGYVIHDFDGSTGCDLYSKLNKTDQMYLDKIANDLIKGRN